MSKNCLDAFLKEIATSAGDSLNRTAYEYREITNRVKRRIMKLDRIGFAAPVSEQESQGEILYPISRLEWLEIKLNAWVGCMQKIESGFFFYRSNPKE